MGVSKNRGEPPQNGWFIMVPNPIKNGWFGGIFPPLFLVQPPYTPLVQTEFEQQIWIGVKWQGDAWHVWIPVFFDLFSKEKAGEMWSELIYINILVLPKPCNNGSSIHFLWREPNLNLHDFHVVNQCFLGPKQWVMKRAKVGTFGWFFRGVRNDFWMNFIVWHDEFLQEKWDIKL